MNLKDIIIKNNLWFIIIPIIITLAMLIPLKEARINPDLNEYLPAGMPSKKNLEQIEEVFGKSDPLLLVIESDDLLGKTSLERIKNLSTEIGSMPEIRQIISLFDTKNIRGEEGFMIVEPAVNSIPENEIDRKILRESLLNNELAYKMVVSENFRYSMIIIIPVDSVTDKELITKIKDILIAYPGEEEVYINGMPFFRYEIQKIALRDLAFLMPVGLAIMMIFLYFSFGEKRGVVLPLSVVSMSIILSMGLLPLMGWDYSIVAILVPVMMIAVANNYGVHIIALYQELNNKNNDHQAMGLIVKNILKRLGIPIILTALTTIAGILGLVTHIMIPAKQMGIVSAAGISFALILSLTFIPAFLSGMKTSSFNTASGNKLQGRLDSLLKSMAGISINKSKAVIYIFIAFFVFAGLGILRLKASINFEKLMPGNHEMRISTNIANEYFGGTKYMSLLFEGDVKDPDMMQNLDYYEYELEKLPGINNVTSVSTIIRLISKALNDPGDQWYNTIPDSRMAIAQYIEFYLFSGDPEDFEQLVDFNFSKALLNIQFHVDDIKDFNRITQHIDSITAGDPYFVVKGGNSLVEKQLSEAIVKGQLRSLAFALAAILILLAFIFKSIQAGLIGSLPLFFTLVCNFGLMGWLGIRLDIGTSLLSSIAIGIGVDYTIHFFWRLKLEIKEGKDMINAIEQTLCTTGKGIAINAISVITGFAVLLLSGLTILKAFAFLIIFSLLLCLLCSLTLIPAICKTFRPDFLFKHDNKLNINR